MKISETSLGMRFVGIVIAVIVVAVALLTAWYCGLATQRELGNIGWFVIFPGAFILGTGATTILEWVKNHFFQ